MAFFPGNKTCFCTFRKFFYLVRIVKAKIDSFAYVTVGLAPSFSDLKNFKSHELKLFLSHQLRYAIKNGGPFTCRPRCPSPLDRLCCGDSEVGLLSRSLRD